MLAHCADTDWTAEQMHECHYCRRYVTPLVCGVSRVDVTNLSCLILTKLALETTVHEGLSYSAVAINVSCFCLLQSTWRGSTLNNKQVSFQIIIRSAISVSLQLTCLIFADLNMNKLVAAMAGLGSRGQMEPSMPWCLPHSHVHTNTHITWSLQMNATLPALPSHGWAERPRKCKSSSPSPYGRIPLMCPLKAMDECLKCTCAVMYIKR